MYVHMQDYPSVASNILVSTCVLSLAHELTSTLAMDTAVVSAAVVYVLLKQCASNSDKRMLFKEIGLVHL